MTQMCNSSEKSVYSVGDQLTQMCNSSEKSVYSVGDQLTQMCVSRALRRWYITMVGVIDIGVGGKLSRSVLDFLLGCINLPVRIKKNQTH